jgi:hypothetical protein
MAGVMVRVVAEACTEAVADIMADGPPNSREFPIKTLRCTARAGVMVTTTGMALLPVEEMVIRLEHPWPKLLFSQGNNLA